MYLENLLSSPLLKESKVRHGIMNKRTVHDYIKDTLDYLVIISATQNALMIYRQTVYRVIQHLMDYRGSGIYGVKGSVPILFIKLHHRGERGEKGGSANFQK